MRRTRRDEDALAFQRAAARIGEFAEMRFDGGKNFGRLGHASRPVFAAGHVAFVRTDEIDAIRQ